MCVRSIFTRMAASKRLKVMLLKRRVGHFLSFLSTLAQNTVSMALLRVRLRLEVRECDLLHGLVQPKQDVILRSLLLSLGRVVGVFIICGVESSLCALPVILHVDSQYAICSVEGHARPVVNEEAVHNARAAKCIMEVFSVVTVEWIAGHIGHPWNVQLQSRPLITLR